MAWGGKGLNNVSMRCPSCSNSIPDAARLCVGCGEAFEPDAMGKRGWGRMKWSGPAVGWVFVAVVVLASVVLSGGVLVGAKVMLVVGVVTIGFLILLLLLGAVC